MPLPDKYKFNFSEVFRRRDELSRNVCYNGPYFGEKFTGETIKTFISHVMDDIGFPESEELRHRVEGVLSFVYGQTLNHINLPEIAWRLACSMPRLRHSKPVYPNFKPVEEHWAPLIIQDVRYGPPSKRDTVQLAVNMRILDGPFAGLEYVQRMAYKFFAGVLAKDIGYPRYKAFNHNEAVQFLFIGLLACTDSERPNLMEYAPTGSSKEKNRQLRKAREEECPRQFSHLCHQCPVGYEGLESCVRATHRATFVLKPCPGCLQEEAYFDPASEEKVCLGCVKRRYKSRMQAVKHGG